MEPLGCPARSVKTNQYSVTSQKSEDLINAPVEAWHHASYILLKNQPFQRNLDQIL